MYQPSTTNFQQSLSHPPCTVIGAAAALAPHLSVSCKSTVFIGSGSERDAKIDFISWVRESGVCVSRARGASKKGKVVLAVSGMQTTRYRQARALISSKREHAASLMTNLLPAGLSLRLACELSTLS